MVTTSSMVGRSKPGCSLCPALSFKDLRRATSSFSIQGRGRSPAKRRGRTSTTRGRSAASVVSSSMPGSLAQLALALLPRDRPRRHTPLGRRSCSWIVLRLLRHDAYARRSVPARPGGLEWGSVGGQAAAVGGAEVVAAGESFSADEIVGATCGRTSGSFALIACPRPRVGTWARALSQQRLP